MSASLRAHDEILREAIESAGGYVFSTAGDSFAAAFDRVSAAVRAALDAQERLTAAAWAGPVLRVRIGLHLGEAEERGGDYFGPTVNTAARVQAAGHGGQTLVTEAVRVAGRIAGVVNLGVHRLRDVDEPVQLWQLGDGDFPRLRVVDPAATNLPVAPSRLIGREEYLRRVRGALAVDRLVTLTAGGGTGKTRVALAVGETELPHRADGVWFVDLTAVSDGAQVPAAVAAGLGLRLVAGDPTGQILDYVTGKDLLLIIDNCEHVIDNCATLAERFVSRPGRAVLLATSRERLDVDGERTLIVPPLSTGDEDATAVELFVERAMALNPSFAGTDADRTTVTELCRRLDGMPLAIELAAARSSVLSPEELLTGIEHRFRLLHGGRRRQRQRTLEATLDWSYNLLDEVEQRMLRAMGVFVGTFDLPAVAAVADITADEAVDLVDSLIAKSLVVREPSGGRSRFRLFETTAAYAQQHLADRSEASDVRDRHLQHYVALAGRHPHAMWADLAARARLGADRANLVAAFEWAAAQHDWECAALLLLRTFTVFYDHPTEGIALTDRCIAEQIGSEDIAMKLRCNQWYLYLRVADHVSARSVVDRLQASSDPVHQVFGICLDANAVATFDTARAASILQRANQIQATLPPGADATQAKGWCTLVAGFVAMYRNEPEPALAHARTVLDVSDQLGFETEPFVQAWMIAAICWLMLGQPEPALEAAQRYRRAAPSLGTGDEPQALAQIAQGDLELARAATRAHARIAVTGRVRFQAAESLLLLAALVFAEGDAVTARHLMTNMGLAVQAGLIAYARHFAERLGIGPEFHANEATLRADRDGDAVKRKAADNIAIVRGELSRRGWDTPSTASR